MVVHMKRNSIAIRFASGARGAQPARLRRSVPGAGGERGSAFMKTALLLLALPGAGLAQIGGVGVETTNTQALISYQAPSAAACSVQIIKHYCKVIFFILPAVR